MSELKLFHAERPMGKFVAFFNDGSGASLFMTDDSGETIDSDGDLIGAETLDNYLSWMQLPDDFEFWCER